MITPIRAWLRKRGDVQLVLILFAVLVFGIVLRFIIWYDGDVWGSLISAILWSGKGEVGSWD